MEDLVNCCYLLRISEIYFVNTFYLKVLMIPGALGVLEMEPGILGVLKMAPEPGDLEMELGEHGVPEMELGVLGVPEMELGVSEMEHGAAIKIGSVIQFVMISTTI